MKKIKAWQRSRKLALGIAFALGCSMAGGASAAEVKAPITGDAAVDTAYADYITSNSSSTTYNFDKDITIKVDSEVNAPWQLVAGSNSYDIVRGIAATKTNANYLYLNPNGNTIIVDVTAHGDTIGAGIFASDARQTINTSADSSGNYDITVTGSADNTQKSYGIWRAITNTTSKSFYVNSQRDEVGDATINITVKNDNGGYGVAVSTPDGADKVKSNGSSVIISGNVNANVSENKKAASILDNSAGLYVDTTNSKITINGKANLDVAGNGIVLDSEPGNSKIEVTKGGQLELLRVQMAVNAMLFMIMAALFILAVVQSAV